MRFIDGASNAALNLSSMSVMGEILNKRGNDALARLAVAVGIMDRRHCAISSRIFDQVQGCRDNLRRIRADELDGTCGYGFRPLGDGTHHKYGFSERWRFFLHPAAVGQDKIAAGLRVNEIEVVKRLNKLDVWQIAEKRESRAHVRIAVNRKYDLHIWPGCKLRKGGADVAKPVAVALAAMTGNENGLLVVVKERKPRFQFALCVSLCQWTANYVEQCIDDSVAGYRSEERRVGK